MRSADLLLPASGPEQAIWTTVTGTPTGSSWHQPLVLRVGERVCAEALAAGCRAVVEAHPPLRSTFRLHDGRLRRCERAPMPSLVRRRLAPERIADAVRAATAAPFALSEGPLIRFELLDAGEHSTLVAMAHRVVLDGRSRDLLVHELATAYQAAERGECSPLRDRGAAYRAWVARERAAAARHAPRARAYWTEALAAGRPRLSLPEDRPSGSGGGAAVGGTVELALEPALAAQLASAARTLGVSRFVLLLSALAMTLRSYGSEDGLVAVAMSAHDAAAADCIASMVNHVPVRLRAGGERSVGALVNRCAAALAAAQPLRVVPFPQLCRDGGWRGPAPRLAVALSYRRSRLPESSLPSGWSADLHVPHHGAVTALAWQLLAVGERLLCRIDYDAGRFERRTVERIGATFHTALERLAAGRAGRPAGLPIVSARDARELREEIAAPTSSVAPAPIERLVAERAARTPHAVAFVAGGERLTYGELDARANRLAQRLRALGVRREALVGVAVERSTAMPVALLGVLKAGGGYVPIDPAYPSERLAAMLSGTRASVLVTEAGLVDALPAEDERATVVLAGDGTGCEAWPDVPPASDAGPDDVAYTIYTSGSTGRPKGVVVPRGALAYLLHEMAGAPGLAPTDAMLAVTSLSFDIAAVELLLPLVVGAVCVIATQVQACSGAALLDALRRHRITAMQATPTTWRLLLRAGWDGEPRVRVLCGGEALPPDLARRLLALELETWNLYGPTETTIWSTRCRIASTADVGAIGRPLPGTHAHVVDPELRPLPIGAPGELLIGGPGVARGYVGQPGATAERFLPDPFSGVAGARLYRTGDLVRRRSGGELEFLGRLDDQVKVRGYRIELGEVEAALAAHPQVREAVAAVRERSDGARELVAYVVPADDGPPTSDALARHLARALPAHMVPSAFARLEAVPLTPNRKVDRRALPGAGAVPLASGSEGERALSPLERTLAEIWGEVLGSAPTRPSDSFFGLGGHSLAALEAAWRIEQRLAYDAALQAIFETATLEQLAARIGAGAEAA